MSRMEEQIQRLKYPGGVDADGHILEDPTLWERYCEAKYKPIALRIREDSEGLQYLEIAGKPSKVNRKGAFAGLGAMGEVTRDKGSINPYRKYGENAPFGAMDAKERLERLDRENLRAAIIYPSIDLAWETECEDADYAQAMTRAYNRWILDWCSDSGGRLIPVAHLSLGDPVAAAAELERAVRRDIKADGSFSLR
jgi:hypothetical protein